MRPLAMASYYPLDARVWYERSWKFGITNFEAAEYHMMDIYPADIQDALNDALAYSCTAMGDPRPQLAVDDGGNAVLLNGQDLVTAFRVGMEGEEGNPLVIPKYPIARQHEGIGNDAVPVDLCLYRPFHVVMANSVIYCNKPGIETGFLALGYPKSAISIDQTTEELIITLRMWVLPMQYPSCSVPPVCSMQCPPLIHHAISP